MDAEIMFTGVSGPNLWRGIRNDEVYRSVVRAFNEYLGEEYCAAYPDRLLGLGVIPEVGVDAAITELKKCKELGLVGVTLNSFPSGKSFPTKDDDRFWAAAVDLDMPITITWISASRPAPMAAAARCSSTSERPRTARTT